MMVEHQFKSMFLTMQATLGLLQTKFSVKAMEAGLENPELTASRNRFVCAAFFEHLEKSKFGSLGILKESDAVSTYGRGSRDSFGRAVLCKAVSSTRNASPIRRHISCAGRQCH